MAEAHEVGAHRSLDVLSGSRNVALRILTECATERLVFPRKIGARIFEGHMVLRLLVVLIELAVMMVWVGWSLGHYNPLPYADDYDSCLRFVNQWVDAPSPALLFEIHNEHAQSLLRVASLASWLLFGRVSFYFLTVLSLGGPILLVVMLLVAVRTETGMSLSRTAAYMLPAVILSFQPGAWQNYLWVTCGLTHAWIPGLLLAVLLLIQQRRWVGAALIGAVMVTIAGGGMLAGAIAVTLALPRWRSRKAVLGGAAGGLLLLVGPLLWNRDVRERAWHAMSLPWGGLSAYTLAFCGNFGGWVSIPVAVCSGVAVSAAAIWLWYTRDRSDPLLGVWLLALIAGAASALLRYDGGGLRHALLTRYGVYGISAASAVYAMALERDRWRLPLCAAATLVSVGVSFANYRYCGVVAEAHHRREAMLEVVSHYDSGVEIGAYPRWATDSILRECATKGTYRVPPFERRFVPRLSIGAEEVNSAVQRKIEARLLGEDPHYLVLRATAADGWSGSTLCTLLKPEAEGESESFCYSLGYDHRSARGDVIDTIIPKQLLKRGRYRVGIFQPLPGRPLLSWLDGVSLEGEAG